VPETTEEIGVVTSSESSYHPTRGVSRAWSFIFKAIAHILFIVATLSKIGPGPKPKGWDRNRASSANVEPKRLPTNNPTHPHASAWRSEILHLTILFLHSIFTCLSPGLFMHQDVFSEYLIYTFSLDRAATASPLLTRLPVDHTMSSNGQHSISRKAVGTGDPPLSPGPQVLSQDGQSQVSARNSGIHWRASTIMVTSLLFGMLLALGHHLFYNHLNGKPVGAPEHVIIGVTRQQLNLTLGTLFAFLVNAFLGIAVTTSYTQVVWRAVKKRATTLATIDTVFHVVTNFWSLVYFSVWWKYPLLLLLALTIWYCCTSGSRLSTHMA
jgi:hypothetical protein